MKNVSSRRRVLPALIAISATATALAQPPPQIVQVARVQMAEIAPTMAVPGTVYSRSEAQITAGVDGLLMFVAEPGTAVKAGDPVAVIDQSMLTLRREEQDALLARAQIQVRQLESEWRRQNELRATNVVSEFQLEQTAANRDLARADARIIDVRIRQISEQIARATTRAPFNGLVVERTRREGEEVSRGTPLARMTDTENMEVRAFVPLKQLSRTRVGDALDVFNDNVRLRATIRALIPTGDVRSQTFEVRIDVPSESLTDVAVGQLVSVAIPIRARASSLAVPRDALVLRSDGSYVYRINADNTAERVSVELGDSSGDLIAVVGTLREGDNVAIRGGETLADGAAVRITDG